MANPDSTSNAEKKLDEKLQIVSKSGIRRVLFSDSFIEKIFLLLLTALVTGLLIPYIGNNIQTRKSKNEMVLRAQAKLLDDITNTILTYETLALDISWYKSSNDVENDTMHKLAFERYSERIVDIFIELRVEIVKAKNLVSKELSEKLDNFFSRIKQDQDRPITSLYKKKETIEKWDAMHQISHDILDEANKLISDIAIDLKITKSNIQ